MNKKVKWSIISVSTATALTFGGLVATNQKTSSNTDYTTENNSNLNQDNYSSSNEDQWQTDDNFSEGNDESTYDQNSDEGSYSQDSSDQGSTWGQDQFQQAPSSGFHQGHGSSGTSR